MKRSWPATVRRTTRRTLTWRPKRAGDATLDIADLVRPFRYDILVRMQLFDLIDTLRPSAADVPELAVSLAEHPYAVWFREVELARFFPWVLDDPAAVDGAFRERVGRAVRTFDSVERNGFDVGRPVTLRLVRPPATSESGVPVSHSVQVGDGGHRLALLHRAGLSLAPSMYRIDPRPSKIIDNTAILAPALRLTEAQWVEFVAPDFVRGPVSSLGELHQAVALECPGRATELAALAEAHHLLGSGSRL